MESVNFYHCPICGRKLDYTPCYIQKMTCSVCPYEAVHYHYGADYQIDGETFHLDDSGMGNAEQQAGIDRAIKRLKKQVQ